MLAMVACVSGECVVSNAIGERAIAVLEWCINYFEQPAESGVYPGVIDWINAQPYGWVSLMFDVKKWSWKK